MSDDKVKEKAVKEFTEALFKKLGPASLKATRDYEALIKHTGGYLSASMAVAYSAGVHKMLNILLKELTNEEQKDQDTAAS